MGGGSVHVLLSSSQLVARYVHKTRESAMCYVVKLCVLQEMHGIVYNSV